MPARQMTEKEVRKKFIRYLIDIAQYWGNLEGKTPQEKVNGAIFSTLVTLDGESANLPAFIVAPFPGSTDKEFYKSREENWYPENTNSNVICDIGGSLHDTFAKMKGI
jgi:hypothetical protein